MIWVGEIMTLQNKKSLQTTTMVSTGLEYQRSLSADDPSLVSIEGNYQQSPVQLGNGQWIFLAAKIRNGDVRTQNGRDKITTLFLQKARQMAARPESLPLNQIITVHDVGSENPDGSVNLNSAFFGCYNTSKDHYVWFIIGYIHNTGQGRPGASSAVDHNGNQFTSGDWVCWPIIDQGDSGPSFFLHYADDDNLGIAGEFVVTC